MQETSLTNTNAQQSSIVEQAAIQACSKQCQFSVSVGKSAWHFHTGSFIVIWALSCVNLESRTACQIDFLLLDHDKTHTLLAKSVLV